MDRVRARLKLREPVYSRLKAVSHFIGNMNKNQLADKIIAEWQKRNVKVKIGGETIELGKRPSLKLEGEDVEIVEVNLDGGERL